jgi:hypothetical protein
MQDESTVPDEISAALEDVIEDTQYSKYLLNVLGDITLLSLWDICIMFSSVLLYNDNVPDCIEGVDGDLLYEAIQANPDEELEILKPIQQWLSEQFVISIDKKEINPRVIGRSVDGKIDTKRTYIDDRQIFDWFLSRGIDVGEDSAVYLYDDYSRSLKRIHNDMLNVSRLMAAKIRNPDFEIPVFDSTVTEEILVENVRLKEQINQMNQTIQTLSRQPIHKKTHGNAERFARNREEVLGAALSVIVQWPKQCKNSSGKFEATKIAKLIDEKSLLYWPETGEPPLGREKMEREISKWIKGDTVK